ncbi:MAG: sterol desaturase family protein, partial [Bacteroidota bacterium]|nr:sterol desaturase family protein [Bacteroidota bacterium]
VHHSDADLDLTTALRFHYGEMIGSLLFRGAVVGLLGATPLIVLCYEILFEAEVLFHHSNIRIPLHIERILNLGIVTPRMHAIHHSQVPQETGSNFASVFTIWDRIHRTARLHYSGENPKIGAPFFGGNGILNLGLLLKLPFLRNLASVRDFKNKSDNSKEPGR